MAWASPSRVAATSTVGVTLLKVPKSNSLYVYVQSAIYLATAPHLLTLDNEHKKSAVYQLLPHSYHLNFNSARTWPCFGKMTDIHATCRLVLVESTVEYDKTFMELSRQKGEFIYGSLRHSN